MQGWIIEKLVAFCLRLYLEPGDDRPLSSQARRSRVFAKYRSAREMLLSLTQ